MAKKRGKGEGSLFKSGDIWVARVNTGYDSKTGKPVRLECRRKNRRDALKWLKENAYKASSKIVNKPEKILLYEWLKRFVAHKKSEGVKPKTLEYYTYSQQKINPELGHFLLKDVRPWHIDSFYQTLSSQGLSSSTRQHIHDFLKGAFKYAYRLQLISENIYVTADIPKPRTEQKRKAKAWTKEEASKFLQTIHNHRLFPVFFLYLKLGLRRGELLALKWEDLTDQTLEISKTLSFIKGEYVIGTPKSERGNRTVYLTDEDLQVLKRQQERQAIERAIARHWHESDYIFTSMAGTPINPDNLHRSFKQLTKLAGLPIIRLHDLRHTSITLMRDAGVDIETAALRAGQDVRVTLSIYSHVSEERRITNAKRLQGLLDIEIPPHLNFTLREEDDEE